MKLSQRKISISLLAVQEAASEPVYRRGVQYYRRKKVLKYEESLAGDHIEALVIGSEPQPYKVVVTVADSHEFKAECSCPYFEELCKHSIAVLLTHIARAAPGTKFDMAEQDVGKEGGQERASRAKDLLDDPKLIAGAVLESDEDDEDEPLRVPDVGARDVGAKLGSAGARAVVPVADAQPSYTLGILVLEKPLAFIVGTVPDSPQGKVNILKVPPEIINTLQSGSRMHRLVKYLASLPQTTKGSAGGHRIPRGEEGIVIGHMSLCCQLLNTMNGEAMSFSTKPVKPEVILSETENGEISLRLSALREEPVGARCTSPLEHPVYFMGPSSWVLSGNVFYPIDLSPMHRLFQFFDSYGQMTIKLEIVPKFLAVDLPVLMKKIVVRLDDSTAPTPIAITEPPRVVIKLNEKSNLELSLGFAYGDLVLPSRDETSAVESELYTRTIAENGQSVWVKRAWSQESQVRRFLNNLQPERVLVDRFVFAGDAALDAVYYLSSPQCSDWQVSGWESLNAYRMRKEGLHLQAKLSLGEDSYKFDFELLCSSRGSLHEPAHAPAESVPFASVVEALFRNRNYVKLESGEYVRLEAATLLSLLKAVGQNQAKSRPLYQALPVLHALESHNIEIQADEHFNKFVERMYNLNKLPALAISQDFNGVLREYQQEGCNWLSFLREYGLAGILADDMGLGKTIQALALLLTHHRNGKNGNGKRKHPPSLVIAPTSVVYNWLSEAEKFTPKISTALFLGRERNEILSRLNPDNERCPDIVLTTYGIIRRDYETLKNHQFEYVILDEAQNIKNPESVGAIGCKSLKAFHRLALSGTPVENRLKELWSLFDFLMPEFLGTYKDFNESFEKPIEAGLDGAGQKLRKIVSPFIMRRLKSQVEKELPDRTDIVNLCELEDDQRAFYLEVLDECRQKVFNEIAAHGIARSQISVLTALLRLRQVCCDPRLIKERPQSSIKTQRISDATHGKLAPVAAQNGDANGDAGANGIGAGSASPVSAPGAAIGSAKLTALLAMIGEIVDEGHKILVFSSFVGMLSIIEKELQAAGYVYEYLDGQTPAKERLEKVNRFNSDESIPIFLISLKAGGTGLNLTGADYVIHYDPWWNPAVENQATDRAHRIGQTRHVFNYKLITRGTVEEKIIALQKKKKELADLIIGGEESVAKELTKEDLEFLFSF